MKALSIRQPWAWLIIHGGKDIENRLWHTAVRGPVLIHASTKMTKEEYAAAYEVALQNNVELPAFDDLERGGIVGMATITACVTQSASPWFFGPHGFVLAKPKPLKFHECKGALNFFAVDYPYELLSASGVSLKEFVNLPEDKRGITQRRRDAEERRA